MAPESVPPAAFLRAVAELTSVESRPEIVVTEAPAPGNLAPFAFALGGTVSRAGEEIATGRLILLHDPDGHDAWEGTQRLVTYVTAELEPEMAADPLIAAVAWSWLTDALEMHDATYRAPGGTVTTTASTRFGDLAPAPSSADLEIRASWSPVDDRFAAHAHAWYALLASAAGLPPPGVTALTTRGVSLGA
ncbi:MAG TPA: DUF3000 domain-containing protein [Micromonosporaceae bacterium]|jgi:hypothetical protein